MVYTNFNKLMCKDSTLKEQCQLVLFLTIINKIENSHKVSLKFWWSSNIITLVNDDAGTKFTLSAILQQQSIHKKSWITSSSTIKDSYNWSFKDRMFPFEELISTQGDYKLCLEMKHKWLEQCCLRCSFQFLHLFTIASTIQKLTA